MKKFVILMGLVFCTGAFAGSPKVECIAGAKQWFYSNTSDGDSQAQVDAIAFCSGKL